MSAYLYVDLDGEGEPTIWRESGDVSAVPVARRCEIADRAGWDALVQAVKDSHDLKSLRRLSRRLNDALKAAS